MSNQLLAPHPWKEITYRIRQANKEGRRCRVAVAYCSTGARELMPLRKGSLLVVNMSEPTVVAGLTNPSEIIKFIEDGVEVHTVANLHAKVFTTGRYAIVGSSNASRTSASHHCEAAVVTTNRTLVQECQAFIQNLSGELVELDHAKRLEELYRPPRSPGVQRRKSNRSVTVYSPLWLVPLVHEGWDEEDHAHHSKARPRAAKQIKPELESLDEFAWVGTPLADRLERGHLVIQVSKQGRTTYLYPPAHVVGIERWTSPNVTPAE